MYKSKLQELCQQQGWVLPEYTTVKDGSDHCPRFTTTVSVNAVPFQSPQNQCKSSKESQNVAAKQALDYFSASHSQTQPIVSIPSSPPSPSLPSLSPGFVASSCNVDVRPAKNQNLQQKHERNAQNSLTNETFCSHKDENRPKDMLHLYKNRLQHCTQKKNLTLPVYSYEFEGPPHIRRFRATVMIDGRTYRSPEYYSTLKDAEHAAAKIALESSSLGEVQEPQEEGLYKTLLQELGQKEGFYFPSYSTIKTGPSHMPTFVSTVEVGGEIYQGRECKSKKQSEMNAAKLAYNGLMERRRISNFSPGFTSNKTIEVSSLSLPPIKNDNSQPNMGAANSTETLVEIEIAAGELGNNIEVSSLSLQPIINDNSQPNMGAANSTGTLEEIEIAAGELGQMDRKCSVLSPGNESKGTLQLSSPSLDSVVACDLQKNIQAKPIPTDLDAEAEAEETNAKGYRCSSPPEKMHDLRPETSPPSLALPNAPSSRIMSSAFVESDAAKPAEGHSTPRTKILVYPRGSTMAIPDGATILACSDDKWVAMRVELNPNQQ